MAYLNDQRNRRKVKEATEKLQINIISPFREGKKLLVLDIDYSKHIIETYAFRKGLFIGLLAILDTKPLTSRALPPSQCARPGLHEFLEALYPHYDSTYVLPLPTAMLTYLDSLYMVSV